MLSPRHTVVIGGGIAGLAAAVELATRKLSVTLLEGRPRLGGRAYSFVDDVSGELVDNGQHAMMGCYTETLAFLEQIGASHKVTRQQNLRVDMRHRDGRRGTIAAATLPGPLHMLSGVLRYRLLSTSERYRALLGGLRLLLWRRQRDARLTSMTVSEILIACGQPVNTRNCFWNPVAIATLNEMPTRAAAAPFVEVLARAFLGARSESQFVLPNVGLSELYTGDARRCIEQNGGRVLTSSAVASLDFADGQVVGARLRDGQRLAFDACIVATPPAPLLALLPDELRQGSPFNLLRLLESSPIVSTHVWFDRPVLDADFTGCVGTTTQWLFNRTRLMASPGHGSGECLSAVISAGRDVVDRSLQEISETVVTDIRALVPRAREAIVRRTVVVKEKSATIATTPAAERWRPAVATPVANLFLAGDWIQTGLPATIESAVVSGRLAARLAEQFVTRQSVRQPLTAAQTRGRSAFEPNLEASLGAI